MLAEINCQREPWRTALGLDVGQMPSAAIWPCERDPAGRHRSPLQNAPDARHVEAPGAHPAQRLGQHVDVADEAEVDHGDGREPLALRGDLHHVHAASFAFGDAVRGPLGDGLELSVEGDLATPAALVLPEVRCERVSRAQRHETQRRQGTRRAASAAAAAAASACAGEEAIGDLVQCTVAAHHNQARQACQVLLQADLSRMAHVLRRNLLDLHAMLPQRRDDHLLQELPGHALPRVRIIHHGHAPSALLGLRVRGVLLTRDERRHAIRGRRRIDRRRDGGQEEAATKEQADRQEREGGGHDRDWPRLRKL
mmetsp:Transcript_53174/g.134325  ORF Transcript_53174/g.134325 Transcript_53174/m.134325 type:complete len:311 (+) Transcript_53174:1893-2825(+)